MCRHVHPKATQSLHSANQATQPRHSQAEARNPRSQREHAGLQKYRLPGRFEQRQAKQLKNVLGQLCGSFSLFKKSTTWVHPCKGTDSQPVSHCGKGGLSGSHQLLERRHLFLANPCRRVTSPVRKSQAVEPTSWRLKTDPDTTRISARTAGSPVGFPEWEFPHQRRKPYTEPFLTLSFAAEGNLFASLAPQTCGFPCSPYFSARLMSHTFPRHRPPSLTAERGGTIETTPVHQDFFGACNHSRHVSWRLYFASTVQTLAATTLGLLGAVTASSAANTKKFKSQATLPSPML